MKYFVKDLVRDTLREVTLGWILKELGASTVKQLEDSGCVSFGKTVYFCE